MNEIETQARLWEMIQNAGPMVKLILFLLLLLSVFSWAIILYKLNLLRKVEKETSSFLDLFWKKRNIGEISGAVKDCSFTPLAKIFSAVYSDIPQVAGNLGQEKMKLTEGLDNLRRIAKKTASMERALIEKSVTFLATTGNTAPFIGLFGTVWGIMNTFRSIGIKGGANIAVVGPGISEALVATAMGLFAAIPAVIGYNHILTRIDRISTEMDGFSTDLIGLVEKEARTNVSPQ